MQSSELTLPDLNRPPMETIPELMRIVTRFVQTLDGEWYDIWQVLDEDEPVVIQFKALERYGLASLKSLMESLERSIQNRDVTSPEVEFIFWQFLINQIESRTAVLNKLLDILRNGKPRDINYALSSQADEIARLTNLVDQFNNNYWQSENGGSSGQASHEVASTAA